MSLFFDKFPKVSYDINRSLYSNYDRVTDLTFRFSILKEAITNISSYYEYVIREGETPEVLADRVYGDPQAYWMILYANDIYDPQYDWPLNYDAFEKYIIGKYGSITSAKVNVHHYEKVLTRQVNNTETVYTERKNIDYSPATYIIAEVDTTSGTTLGQSVVQLEYEDNGVSFEGIIQGIDAINNTLTLQTIGGKLLNYSKLFDENTLSEITTVRSNNHEFLEFFVNLSATPIISTYVIGNTTVTETISRNEISCYDYEVEQNDAKRFIKVIKKEYYSQIMKEFATITNSIPTFYRKLK